ncbi:hypothetical protein, variant [Phialophora macrospora]|nr:hypothetical protein, variant [Phialophora macrospora]
MRDFLTRMAGYIEYQLSAPPALDDEPRIWPLQGTVIEDLIPEDLTADRALLQYDSDTESSDGDALEPMQHLTAYWKPRSGNISILPPMYAKEIAQLTGASLFAEEAEKRYRILQGNIQLAREKLVRLEPLLETLAAQTSNMSLHATGDLLIWPPNQQDSKLQYVNMVPGHFSYDRVVVNRQEQTLFRKVLGELRCFDSRTRLLEIPHNLQYLGVAHTAECQASKIWNGQQYASFGDPENMVPVITSNPTSVDNSDTGTVKDAENDRITAWTNTIVPSADPEIAPEAPVERGEPRRRRVLVHSDSDDDEPPPRVRKAAPSVAQRTTPAPLIQLSDEKDLIDVSTQPARKSQSFLSSSRADNNNNTLVDILEEESMPLSRSSTQALQPQSYDLEDDTTAARKPHACGTEQLANDGSADILKQMAGSPSPRKEDFFDDQALIDMQVESSGESHEVPSPPTEIPATNPEGPPSLLLQRPVFDPNAYRSSPQLSRDHRGRGGQQRRQGQRRRGNDHYRGRNQNNKRADQPQPKPAPTRAARGGHREGAHAGSRSAAPVGRSSRGRGTRANIPRAANGNLIDVRVPVTASGAPVVPPGFESIVPLVPETVSRAPAIPPGFESEIPLTRSGGSHIDALQSQHASGNPLGTDASSQPHMRSSTTSQSPSSGRSRNTLLKFSDEGSEWVTTVIPKVDQAALRERSVQEAMAAMATMAGKNKKAEEDSPPKTHSIMRQQAGNPAKPSPKKASKKETKEEAAARRRRAIEEAHGPTPTVIQQQSTSPKVEEMSEWKKKQLKKKTPLAKAHVEIVEDNLRDQQAYKLVGLLQPVFEVGRRFKGKLNFEIQIGQVLVSPGQPVFEKTYHSVEDWKSYFDSRGSGHSFSSFTKILTANGADIDRALEAKGAGRGGNLKLWDATPCSLSVTYEFQCQSRSNENFQIIVDETGRYGLRKGLINVGTISIHVPSQIWDLSAALSGPLEWSDPSATVAHSVNIFVESLYVLPDRKKIMLYFRPPHDGEFKIRNLIVRRVSYHPSNRPDGKDIALKVTEAKNLQFKVHADDRKLWLAYEPTFDPDQEADYRLQLADTGRIHYELSVVHRGINDVLAKNESLEIGELTDPDTTGQSLLDRTIIRSLLDTAVQLVSKIDYVGMWNYGTQKRLREEENERREKLLGPRGRTNAPGTGLVLGSIMGGSRMHTMTGSVAGGSLTQQPIPGVRLNTVAEIMVDDSGNQYYLGMGGARVPIALSQELIDAAATVMPDDSASNAGRGPHFVGASRTVERGAAFW